MADVWAEDAIALAGAGATDDSVMAGAQEGTIPEEAPVLYWITLPDMEHLIVEPEKEHIYIPDPDTRSEEEKKDIILSYEAGEDVEIGIRAEDAWQITKLCFLNEKREESGYEWKDGETVHFRMPDRNLVMETELTAVVVPEEVTQDIAVPTDLSQQPIPEEALPSQAGIQPEDQQASAAEMEAVPEEADVGSAPQEARTGEEPVQISEAGQDSSQDTGSGVDPAQDADGENVTSQDPGSGEDSSQNPGNDAGNDTGDFQQAPDTGAGSDSGTAANREDGSAAENEMEMTYVPEKEADGLPAQGSQKMRG